VSAVSADAYEDEALQQSYYRADIGLEAGMLERLGDVALIPACRSRRSSRPTTAAP
jgi:hypothetical protein